MSQTYVLSTTNPNWRDVRKRAAEYIASLPVGTAKLAVEIKPYRATRSAEQNRLYWRMLNEIAEQVRVRGRRFSAEVWHEHYAEKLLPREEMEMPSGEIKTKRASTADQNVEEFSDYMDEIAADATSEYGVVFEERRVAA